MITDNLKIPDFTQAAVLVVGDIMLDRYLFGDTARISPEAPVPVVNIKQTEERPGGAGNVALNIKALGVKTSLIGVSGNDSDGRSLVNHLSKAGVSHNIYAANNSPTITKQRVISRNQQLIRMDFEEKFPTTHNTWLIENFTKYLQQADLVIISDYQKGTLAEATLELIKLARRAGLPVLIDPKGSDFSKYTGATLLTPNFKEFEQVVGKCHNEQEITNKGLELLNKLKLEALLLTRGEHGMTLIRKDLATINLPAHAKEVFDVTGAGDTVIAALGAALAAKSSLTDAMIIANLAASLAVSKLGAATVSTLELQTALVNEIGPPNEIVNEDQLNIELSKARAKGERIVFTNGCFDILHSGHITYLKQARQLGDKLVVAINSDSSVKRLKGNDRPINTVEHRMEVLAALGVVDWVISFADDTPIPLLKKLQPEILVKGGDYKISEVVGGDIVNAYGGDVRVLSCVPGHSTTAIIDRAAKSRQKDVSQLENN